MVIQQQRETSMGRCSIASLNHNIIEDDLPPDPLLQTKTLDNSPRDEEEKEMAKANEDKNRNLQRSPRLEKPMTLQEKTMKRVAKKQQFPDTRNEIIAVAPKKNQLSLVEQLNSVTGEYNPRITYQSETIGNASSMLVTASDFDNSNFR